MFSLFYLNNFIFLVLVYLLIIGIGITIGKKLRGKFHPYDNKIRNMDPEHVSPHITDWR